MILDTNAVSALGDGDPDLAERMASVNRLAIPVIVLGEYRFGIQFSRLRKERESWLNQLEQEVEVLPVTAQTARHYATIRTELKRYGRPIPESDLWIAAIAAENALPLLSRDQHFDNVKGVRRLDW